MFADVVQFDNVQLKIDRFDTDAVQFSVGLMWVMLKCDMHHSVDIAE